MTNSWWFEYTTFLAMRRADADEAYWRSPMPRSDSAERARADAEAIYERDLIAAWNSWRPNGPLSGEALPGEVERIQASRAMKP